MSASSSGAVGYFTNIPQTRRQGLELGVQQQLGPVKLQAAYAFVDATYQSSFTIQSPNNSTANAAGDIQVQPGDHIPGIPRNNFKLRADWQATPKLSIGGTLVYASSQYAQGDNNNQDVNGPVPGYTIFNLDGRYYITDQLQVFGAHQQPVQHQVSDRGRSGRELLHRPELQLQPRRRATFHVQLAGRPFRYLDRRALRFRETREARAFPRRRLSPPVRLHFSCCHGSAARIIRAEDLQPGRTHPAG